MSADKPFTNPQTQLQRDRLELNRQQFDLQKKRYEDQQATAAARLKAQQEQAASQRAAGPASAGGGGGGGGKKNQAQEEKLRKENEELKKKLKEAGKKGSGGGGRGGGGLSPEQKARNKAREGRQMEREKDRDRARADYNNTTEQRAGKAKTASDYYSIRDSDKPAPKSNSAATGAKGKTGSNNSPGGDPSYGPGTGGSNDTTGNAAAAAGMYNFLNDRNPTGEKETKKRDWNKNPPVNDSEAEAYEREMNGGPSAPKMVRAYGNKHANVWVKARGDFR